MKDYFSYQNYSKLHDYVKYRPKTDFTAKSAQFCATILLSFLDYPGEKKDMSVMKYNYIFAKKISKLR